MRIDVGRFYVMEVHTRFFNLLGLTGPSAKTERYEFVFIYST